MHCGHCEARLTPEVTYTTDHTYEVSVTCRDHYLCLGGFFSSVTALAAIEHAVNAMGGLCAAGRRRRTHRPSWRGAAA